MPSSLTRHTSSSVASWMRAKSAADASPQWGLTWRVSRSFISADTHVRACTPLVMAPMGTSSAGISGHSGLNISRLTTPWSWATPLLRAASRKPMTAMLNRVWLGSSGSCPRARRSSTEIPASAQKPVKYFSISSRGKRSMPAGTGVWVVNTEPARTASMASGKASPSPISSRMRSRPRKPAWPSLVWNTWVSTPSARSARTPPMPSSISWRRRCSESPP